MIVIYLFLKNLLNESMLEDLQLVILLHIATETRKKMLWFLDDALILSISTFSFLSSPTATSFLSVSSQLPTALKVRLKWGIAATVNYVVLWCYILCNYRDYIRTKIEEG